MKQTTNRSILIAITLILFIAFVFYKIGYKEGVNNERCEQPNCFEYYVDEDEWKTSTMLGFNEVEFSSYIWKEGGYFNLETVDSVGKISYSVIVDLRSNKSEVIIRNLSCYASSDDLGWAWANCRMAWNANLTKEK